MADYGLVYQPLAEDESLVGPFEGFFDDDAGVADGGAWVGVSEGRMKVLLVTTHMPWSIFRG